MKVITLCGSLRFNKEMLMIACNLSLEGICVLTPVYSVLENAPRTDEQLDKLRQAHFKRIDFSDAIFVINVDDYIGSSTKLEIEYAKDLGKEILYYTDYIKKLR